MQVANKLVNLIEQNADSLSRKWLSLVQTHPGTVTYHTYDPHKLYERAFRVYSQLGKWLSHETSKEQVAEKYGALGAQRFREGFKVSEVVMALTITRRVLWFKVLEDGFLDTALDLHMALELNNQVIHFFDCAITNTIAGYERCKAAAGNVAS